MLDPQDLRRDFPALSEMTFLNNGAVGITPAPVVEKMLAALRFSEQSGQAAYEHFADERDRARAAVAGLIGAEPSEVAFGNNATEAINWVLASFQFRPDEEILISDYEHPALIYPSSWQRQQGKARVTRFSVDADPAATLAAVEAAIGPRTRMVAISHVERHNGVRLPVAEICELAARRGVLTLVDGAQSLGMFPVNVKELGSDFYIGNLHKWLCGPNGTGVLQVRSDRLRLLSQQHVGPSGRWGETTWDLAGGVNLPEAAYRFEYGTSTPARYTGTAESLAYLGELGWEAIEERLRGHKMAAQQSISDRGWRLLSPPDWEDSSALVAFKPSGDRGGRQICQELAEKEIYLSATQDDGIRLSPHIYNTSEEIEHALDAVAGANG